MASLCHRRPPRRLQLPLLLLLMMNTLVLLLVPSHAQQSSTKSDISVWDSLYSSRFLRLESDGLVHAQGRGRRRPTGLSITQTDEDYSVVVHSPLQLPEDTVLDRNAIGFDPDPVELRGAMACKASVQWVTIVNLAQDRSVRIDEIVIDHEAITTPSFMRGTVLDPGENMTWSFLMLPLRAENLQTYARVITTAGEFRLLIQGQVKPNYFDVEGIEVSIPVGALYENEIVIANTQNEMVRVTEIFSMEDQLHLSPKRYNIDGPLAREEAGEWNIPPGIAKPVTTLQFRSNEPGLYISRILIIGTNIQLIVPVHVQVLAQGVHLTPGEVDLGLLASIDEPREFFVTIYNTNPEPIVIQQLNPVHSNVHLSALAQDGTLIPPMTRVQRGFQIYVQGKQAGVMYAMLRLITNGTEASTDQRILRVTGYIMSGDLAYDLEETIIGVSAPLANMFDLESAPGTMNVNQTSQSRLMSRSQFHGLNATRAGTFASHSLHVINNYERPLTLERVWIEPENAEVTIESFEKAVALQGEHWPAIKLGVNPSLTAPVAPRSYAVMVATQLTIHNVPIHLHYGLLTAESSSGLGAHLTYGVESASHTRRCDAINLIEHNASNSTDTFNGQRGSRVCRALIFDLGNVSTFGERLEILNLSNINPIPIDIKFRTVPGNVFFNLSLTSRILPPQENELNKMVGEFPVTEYALNDTEVPLLNDTITLPARYLATIRIRFLATKRKFSTFSAHVLTIETPSEILHLYTRFKIVRGSIYPTVTTIMMPPITRGKTSFVELYYRNTFAQNVTVKAIAFTNKHLIRPARITHLVPAQDTISVMKLGILLELDKKCTQSRAFYEDCFLPQGFLDAPDTRLSWYNEPLTSNDIAALQRRQEVWREDLPTHDKLLVETNVFLHTNMMHTHPVSVKAWQVPARIFSSDNSGRLEFDMTEIFHHRQMYVHVENPTEEPVLMELVWSDDIEPSHFYDCDLDKSEQDCVHEWQAENTKFRQCKDGVAECSGISSPPPPLYFKANSVHRIPGHGYSDLGPIYYLPSIVGNIDTTIFVRNDLTHLEPIKIVASSGKADLAVSIYVEEQDETTVDSADSTMNFASHLAFKVADAQHAFQDRRYIQLSNAGTFNLLVNNIFLPPQASRSFSFFLEHETDGQAHTENSISDPFILVPKATTDILIVYSPSCKVSQERGQILIQARDTVKTLQLVGHITLDAAFARRKANTTALLTRCSRYAWVLSVCVAVGISLFSILSVARELIYSGRYHSKPIECKSVLDPEREPVPHVSGKLTINATSLPKSEDAIRLREQMLAKIEASSATTIFSVSTPAVSELLHRRHKGIPLNNQLEKSLVQAVDSNESAPDASRQIDNQEPEPVIQQTITDLHVNVKPQAAAEMSSTHKRPQTHSHHKTTDANQTSPLATHESADTKHSEGKASSSLATDNQTYDRIETADKSDSELELEEASYRGSNSTDASTESELLALSTHAPDRPPQTSNLTDQLKPLAFDSSLSLDWRLKSNFKDSERPLPIDTGSDNFELRSLALDSVQLPSKDDSDWYFDSLQAEIGKLVNFATESSPIFTSRHQEPSSQSSASSKFAVNELHLPPLLATKPPNSLAPPPGLGVNTPGPSSRPAPKKAPPGFTPADANPEESLAAFERLRSSSTIETPSHVAKAATASGISQGSTSSAFTSSFMSAESSVFPTHFSLFGPAFEASTDRRGVSTHGSNANASIPIVKASAGRIGSGRPTLGTPSPSIVPDQRQ